MPAPVIAAAENAANTNFRKRWSTTSLPLCWSSIGTRARGLDYASPLLPFRLHEFSQLLRRVPLLQYSRLPPLAGLLPPAPAGALERLDVAACDVDRRSHRDRVADIVGERRFGPLAQASRGDQPVSREFQDVTPVDVRESRKLRHGEVHGLENEYARAFDAL